jgi:hypothetical protein
MKLFSTAALGATLLALGGCGGSNPPIITAEPATVGPVAPVLPPVTPPLPVLPAIQPPVVEIPDEPVYAGVRISGAAIAASGLALAHADIAVKCQTGYGTTTALADGSYSASLPGAALPCMVQAFGDSLPLYGLATGTGPGTVVANVSPLTELIMAASSHADPAVIFAGYPASAIGAADLARGTATVIAALSASGIDLSGASPLGSLLAAGVPAAALASRLNTGASTLAALVAAFQDGSSDLTRTLLVAPPVAACPQYRSGSYRIVFSNGRRGVLLADWGGGAAGITTDGAAASGSIAFSSADACRFTYTGIDGTVLDGAASIEGLLVLRDAARGASGVGLPVQAYTVADTAGGWNTAEYLYDSTTQAPGNAYSTLVISPTGAVTKTACNEIAADCLASADQSKVVANAATGALSLEGRLDSGYSGGEPVYLYRSPRRGKLLVIPLAKGGILVATPAGITAPLPVAGSTNAYFDVSSHFGPNGAEASFVRTSATILLAYAPTGSVFSLLATAKAAPQQRFYDQPRAGMRYRPQTSQVGVQVMLTAPGTGLAVYGGSGNDRYFGFSALVE